MTYESQAVRPLGERKKASVEMEPYDGEDRWHQGLASEKRTLGELGYTVW